MNINLKIIPLDKLNHILYGWCISTIILIFLENVLMLPTKYSILISLSVTVLVAMFKEYMDFVASKRDIFLHKKPSHRVEVKDVLYTSLGGIFANIYPIIFVITK